MELANKGNIPKYNRKHSAIFLVLLIRIHNFRAKTHPRNYQIRQFLQMRNDCSGKNKHTCLGTK